MVRLQLKASSSRPVRLRMGLLIGAGVAITSWVPAAPSASATNESAPGTIGALLDLARLPRLDSEAVCRQFASTDPKGQGDDHGHFLRLDGGRAVLAEMDGPGVIARLWSANAAGRIRVFLDGEAEPRIDAPFQDLFTGNYAPFCEPIATHQGGGWISYFPIAYQKHCRVEVDQLADPHALYYQVQYLTWPAGTAIRTFTRELPDDERVALVRAVEVWRAPAAFSSADREPLIIRETRMTLASGKTASIHDEVPVSGSSGMVEWLRLDLKEATVEQLRGLLLEVRFDQSQFPSISAPVADFFGVGFGARLQTGLLLGWDARGGYCRMPMPYGRSIEISVVNQSAEPVEIELVAGLRPQMVSPSARPLGYLHAEYRRVDPVGAELYEFANVGGAGKFVGVNLTLQGVGDLWYLEGNEEFSIDGEAKPSIVGTGTEDFFNGGWYWDSGPLTLPLHGLGVKEEWTTNRTTPWRHYLTDAVPFRTGFIGRIEHGSHNAVRDASYSSVAFWYGARPSPVRAVTPESAQLPRRWVRRPKEATPAVTLEWAPNAAMQPAHWEAISTAWRASDHSLFQSFPVSYFERERPALAPELVLLHGAEARATFTIDSADRYRCRLLLARQPNGGSVEVLIDGHAIGTLSLVAFDSSGVEAWLSDGLGPVGLARGSHELLLRRIATSGATGGDSIGLDSIAFESAAPFIRSWWIAPPVECDPRGTVEQVPAVEPPFLAAGFDPEQSGWRAVPDAGEVLDLNHHITPRAPIFGYVATWLFAPTARVATARLGSDDGVRVWCNGVLAWSHALHRPLAIDADRFDLVLREGWNLLLVKVRTTTAATASRCASAIPTAI